MPYFYLYALTPDDVGCAYIHVVHLHADCRQPSVPHPRSYALALIGAQTVSRLFRRTVRSTILSLPYPFHHIQLGFDPLILHGFSLTDKTHQSINPLVFYILPFLLYGGKYLLSLLQKPLLAMSRHLLIVSMRHVILYLCHVLVGEAEHFLQPLS